jgi:hypothetical protein
MRGRLLERGLTHPRPLSPVLSPLVGPQVVSIQVRIAVADAPKHGARVGPVSAGDSHRNHQGLGEVQDPVAVLPPGAVPHSKSGWKCQPAHAHLDHELVLDLLTGDGQGTVSLAARSFGRSGTEIQCPSHGNVYLLAAACVRAGYVRRARDPRFQRSEPTSTTPRGFWACSTAE